MAPIEVLTKKTQLEARRLQQKWQEACFEENLRTGDGDQPFNPYDGLDPLPEDIHNNNNIPEDPSDSIPQTDTNRQEIGIAYSEPLEDLSPLKEDFSHLVDESEFDSTESSLGSHEQVLVIQPAPEYHQADSNIVENLSEEEVEEDSNEEPPVRRRRRRRLRHRRASSGATRPEKIFVIRFEEPVAPVRDVVVSDESSPWNSD